MKCPLRRWVFDAQCQQLIPEQLDCLKEECAWWIKLTQRCALTQMVYCLDDLSDVLKDIRGP